MAQGPWIRPVGRRIKLAGCRWMRSGLLVRSAVLGVIWIVEDSETNASSRHRVGCLAAAALFGVFRPRNLWFAHQYQREKTRLRGSFSHRACSPSLRKTVKTVGSNPCHCLYGLMLRVFASDPDFTDCVSLSLQRSRTRVQATTSARPRATTTTTPTGRTPT